MLAMIRFKLKIKKHVVVCNKCRRVWKTDKNTNSLIIVDKCNLKLPIYRHNECCFHKEEANNKWLKTFRATVCGKTY